MIFETRNRLEFYSRLTTLKIIVSVILVTGGYGGGHFKSAQIYFPQSGRFCSLPDMKEGINLHTQDGSLICGGYPTGQSCSEWKSDSGTWNSYNLPRTRKYSESWTPQSGVGTYLTGDESTHRATTDLIKPDGTVQQGFNLKYDTRFNAAF